MELIKNLFGEKGYIDGITIIDTKGEILFTVKFNSKLNSNSEDYEVIGKNFYEIYENLSGNKSSMYKAMELEMPIYIKNQKLKPKNHKEILISSLSIPIKSGGRIVGAIDLSSEEISDSKKFEKDTEISLDELKKINLRNLSLNKNGAKYTLNDIITNNFEMKQLKEFIKTISDSYLPVMIYGETGTGKELFAQAIHNESKRKDRPFIAQNCAAIPENLLESIFFGTAKGAFTGAVDSPGLLETADGGTIFLDEINSMPMNLQSKLLRALQENKIRRIGAKDTIDINVKIIAALNKDPMKAIEDKELRMDLYYRLSVLNITIPPLRERKDDISVLVNYFVAKYNELLEKNVRYISSDICQIFQTYDWPGNIREIEHIVAFGMSVIRPDQEKLEFSDLERKWIEITGKKKHKTELPAKDLKTMVEEYEKSVIEKVLEVSAHNITKASLILKIPRQTLQRKIKQYEL